MIQRKDIYSGGCVTVGTFDGVHLGHRAILGTVAVEAESRGLEPVVLTFDAHPLTLVKPREAPKILTDPDDRMALLRASGVDRVEMVRFDQGFSGMTPEEFVGYLKDNLDCRVLVMGYDNAIGKGRTGTPEYMRGLSESMGFDLVEVGPVSVDGRVVSSTGIRACLASGDVTTANAMLGRDYMLKGMVITGDGRGRKLGMATANLGVGEYMVLPADGVYATRAIVSGKPFPSVTNIGLRPTFYSNADNPPRTVEVHILDFSGDLYEETMRLEFVGRIRGERRFASAGELLDQVGRDVNSAKQILGNI